MRERLGSIDRRLAAAGLALLVSAALLVTGLVSILLALNDDNLDLPSEGSLEQILAERKPAATGDSRQAAEADTQALSEQEAVRPVGIRIPRIEVDAPIVVMGLDSRNYPEVPNSGDEVAWYTFSSAPGRGSNAVFSGHVDWYYWGMPDEGVFYHLRELEIGDEISLDLEDGREIRYTVTGNVAIPYEDPNVIEVMGPTSKDVITLITCGGTWQKDYSNPNGGNYSHRVIVRAELVEPAVRAPATTG